ncbi:hypothetical protein [Streptomyces sp. NPDC056264]|uniref:hypothetical protein n=1 Tax=Streptomyces sp. NPDC056264 TaxID=3345767 RepID=UPI003AAE1359
MGESNTARETAPATRGDVQWVGFVASTTGFGMWALNRFVFKGDLPPEAAAMVQYGVPLGLGWIAAEVRWRTARRRGAAAE